MAIQYNWKKPDMSRNMDLAGKTVYSRGMNVTYDENGYAVSAENPHYSGFAGTTRSVAAQPKEDALAGKSWTPPDTSDLVEWSSDWDPHAMGGGDTRAARSTGGTGSAYDGSYGSGYPSAYDAQRAAYEAAVQRAEGQLTAQKTATNESYDDYARQAYRDKMAAQRDIGQYLGARGVTGGAAESTVLGLNTSYADELRRIEQSRRETLSALDRAIADARLTGDINSANAAAAAAKEQAALYAQEMAERKAAAAAQEQSARAEAQEQRSWARTLAGQMLAAGRMPDDATLAAAGITRAQAELLLTGTDSDTYEPGFTRAQVLDALYRAQRNGQTLTGNLLRDYNYYIHNDPDYIDTPAGPAAYSAAPAGLPPDTPKADYDREQSKLSIGDFTREMQTIMAYLGQGRNAQAEQRINYIWDKLTVEQQAQARAALQKNGVDVK